MKYESGYCSRCQEPARDCGCLLNCNPKSKKSPDVPKPRKLFMSSVEIFDRINRISALVAEKNYRIPEAARLRIAEELVRLGYELAESND